MTIPELITNMLDERGIRYRIHNGSTICIDYNHPRPYYEVVISAGGTNVVAYVYPPELDSEFDPFESAKHTADFSDPSVNPEKFIDMILSLRIK